MTLCFLHNSKLPQSTNQLFKKKKYLYEASNISLSPAYDIFTFKKKKKKYPFLIQGKQLLPLSHNIC